MQTINIHKVKTHLSSLVDQVFESGEAFIIAKSGKPMVKVVPIDAPEPEERRRLGFMAGKATIPDDFDSMGQLEIEGEFSE